MAIGDFPDASYAVIGATLLMLQAALPAQSPSSDAAPCGGAFAATIAQQQAIPLNTTQPCRDSGAAPARHYDDAAAYDRAGGPAIFGSVALPVSRTPFDARLRVTRSPNLARSVGPWSPVIAEARHMDRASQLRHVNRWVNDRLGYASDQALSGTDDLWSPASVTLARGRGDCEDYAIAKMALLATLDFRTENLFLVLVRDGAKRADHAILAVREDGRFHVLDSTTNEVRASSHVPDYFPVMSFAAGRAWLHGYRTKNAVEPLRVAATMAPHSDWNDRGR